MKRKWFIFGLILSVSINVGVFASAGYRFLKNKFEETHRSREIHSPMNTFCKKLGLTEEQRNELESIRGELDIEINEIKKELKEKRAQLIDHLKAPGPDQEKIDTGLSEIESLQTKIQKIVINHMLKEKEVLSPKQQEIYFSTILNKLCPNAKHQEEGFFPMAEETERGCKIE